MSIIEDLSESVPGRTSRSPYQLRVASIKRLPISHNARIFSSSCSISAAAATASSRVETAFSVFPPSKRAAARLLEGRRLVPPQFYPLERGLCGSVICHPRPVSSRSRRKQNPDASMCRRSPPLSQSRPFRSYSVTRSNASARIPCSSTDPASCSIFVIIDLGALFRDESEQLVLENGSSIAFASSAASIDLTRAR